jgi:hypothetical protein
MFGMEWINSNTVLVERKELGIFSDTEKWIIISYKSYLGSK